MQKPALLAALALCGTLGACAPMKLKEQPPPTPAQVQASDKTRDEVRGVWALKEASKLPAIPGQITLNVQGDDPVDKSKMRVNGFSGVNYYISTATVSWPDHLFRMEKLVTTQEVGSETATAFEQALLPLLSRVVDYRLEGEAKLTLTTMSGETLIFERMK